MQFKSFFVKITSEESIAISVLLFTLTPMSELAKEIIGNDSHAARWRREGNVSALNRAQQLDVEPFLESYSCHVMIGFGDIINNVWQRYEKRIKKLYNDTLK